METLELSILAAPPDEISENTEPKAWEDFTSCWTVINAYETECQWTKGDLVSELGRTFGNDKGPDGRTPIEVFATDIGAEIKTLRQYRWVSETFSSREDRCYDNLSWSHYRAAAGTDDPKYWTKLASDNSWSVARMAEEIKTAQDKASVELGRPCTRCGSPLPETGSIHTRRDGQKEGSFCNEECLLQYYLQIYKAKQSTIIVTESVEAEKETTNV